MSTFDLSHLSPAALLARINATSALGNDRLPGLPLEDVAAHAATLPLEKKQKILRVEEHDATEIGAAFNAMLDGCRTDLERRRAIAFDRGERHVDECGSDCQHKQDYRATVARILGKSGLAHPDDLYARINLFRNLVGKECMRNPSAEFTGARKKLQALREAAFECEEKLSEAQRRFRSVRGEVAEVDVTRAYAEALAAGRAIEEQRSLMRRSFSTTGE